MSDDGDFVLCTFPRAEGGELRLSRSKFKGKIFTKFQIWYDAGGELKPGRQVVTIRDHELPDEAEVLQKILTKVGGSAGAAAPAERQTSTHQNQLVDANGEEIF